MAVFLAGRARFSILEASRIQWPGLSNELRASALFIQDMNGPRSVTNDVGRVVEMLTTAGYLPAGRRLFYFDSAGQLDEILRSSAGEFAGFAPGPRAPELEDAGDILGAAESREEIDRRRRGRTIGPTYRFFAGDDEPTDGR